MILLEIRLQKEFFKNIERLPPEIVMPQVATLARQQKKTVKYTVDTARRAIEEIIDNKVSNYHQKMADLI